jgi:hypothetical protein
MILLCSAHAGAQEFSKVEIKTIKVAGNVYLLHARSELNPVIREQRVFPAAVIGDCVAER